MSAHLDTAHVDPDWQPGPHELPSGRLVYYTGKVKIGERAGERQCLAPRRVDWQRRLEPMSADAEWLQQLLAERGQSRDRVTEFGHRLATAVGTVGLVGAGLLAVWGPR